MTRITNTIAITKEKPSVSKPWLKYYTEEQINAPLPHMTAYEYLKQQNADRLDYLAIDSEVGNYTYGELFAQIDATAKALWALGIQKGHEQRGGND